MDYQNQSNELEFRQIVLSHLKRILEISSHELRDTTTETHQAYSVFEVQREDLRLSYIQAIENLGYVLIPYFDDEMWKVYNETIDKLEAFGYEIKEKFKEEYNKVVKDIGKEAVSESEFFVLKMKLKSAKKLFVALNQLLKRNDYLQSGIFGEGDDEVVEAEQGGSE